MNPPGVATAVQIVFLLLVCIGLVTMILLQIQKFGMTRNAVIVARSKVLRKLRELAGEFLD